MNRKNLYILNIMYQGQDFFGFERQQNHPSVKGVICQIIDQHWHPKKLKVYCSSRTDAKVHALDQYVLINSELEYEKIDFAKIIAQNLPESIKIKKAFRPPIGFDLLNGSNYKEYRYLFCYSPEPLEHPFFTAINEPFDLELMQKACQKFVGKHDFVNFQFKSKKANTFREIFEMEIIESDQFFFEGNYPDLKFYQIRVKGEGYMRHMVRLMSGAIFNIGIKKHSLEDLDISLTTQGVYCTYIAPAQGLYQYQAYYPILDSITVN